MKKIHAPRLLALGLAAALTALAGCAGSGMHSHMGAAAASSAAPLAAADRNFVNTAAAIDMYEIQSGQLAASRAQNAQVRSYGQMLVAHHTATSRELMALAKAKNHTPPAALPPEFQAKVAALSRQSGAGFDRDFVRMTGVQDHMNAIALFEQHQRTVADPDLKAFIAKSLPVLRQHLQQAQTLAGGMAG